METEKTFKTKTGYCHIFPDKIVLTRDGVVGNVAKIVTGKSISRLLIIYSILSLVLLYSAYNSLKNNQILESVLLFLVGVYLIYGILTSLNNSASPIIDRKKITNIKFKKAIIGLTRSRFEVFFKDEKGKIKKRLIMLPGSMNDGQNETKTALKIMQDENLLAQN